ncbi:hypothetical protein U0C82_12690 [Fulvimarina sp. 2208YS6-2-32]|uniref:STAS domain-containing protein n=1 Tax=Fulvimarina uroteuthidis TaxID=3098149 RepID=A0ABU5I3N6_9HYPH|nr:hypothetical protein [Fulvimarina sp. 2208YS6-2-32]MDY8109997.1 hypothetical protein [Fulvimarina sp. 2208YS6-2-32]
MSIDAWRLWIVPMDPNLDKREFYRRVGTCLRTHEQIDLDISDIQMMSASHRGIKGLSEMFRIDGLSSVHLSNDMLDGFFLSDGIVLRMAVKQTSVAA